MQQKSVRKSTMCISWCDPWEEKNDDVENCVKTDFPFFIMFQVVIVGNGAVGKSSMIQRYCKGIFTRNYKKTIGVDFLEKHIT